MDPASVHATLDQWIVTDGFPIVVDLEKSSGSYVRDAKSGTEYLDFFSFVAARPLGFNHPGLKRPDFLERLQRVAIHKLSNCDTYTVEYAEFVESFGQTALDAQFRHLFFIEGGAPAVETALKAAMDWKHRKNLEAGRGEKGSQILHFKQCFHGRTGYALSLSDSHDQRKSRFFPKFDWPRVSNPCMTFPFDEAAERDVKAREAKTLDEIRHALETSPDDIAAIIIEPIQGEGGDNFFRSEFLRALRKFCDDHEMLLIFDEVQTGFGSTGRWWDWQHHDAKPDLLVFGKKTQVCGVAAGDKLDEVESVFEVPSRISSTFGGNLTDMVRCHRIIEIIGEDDLVANSATMGSYMLKVIGELAEGYPQLSAVRGRGLWLAFDLPSQEERDKLVEACFAEELLVSKAGRNVVRLRAALDVDADSIGRAAAQLEAGLLRAFSGKS